ncbi:MAG: restriction endonuclease subunit S [Desulfosporosinus sp.]|nr:restriction endonuclease subunit S [Desulfosporosinus sp.]
MLTVLEPYDEYKNIELLWLDTIPTHWHFVRAKTMFKIVDIRSETGEEELLSVSSKNGVVKRTSANVTMFKAESYKGYKLCWPEDLVVNSLWAWQRGLGFSRYFGIISTAYSVYRLTNEDRFNYKYYDYLVRGVNYAWELRVRSKGIWKSRYQLSDQSFMDSAMICPPKDEQDQIVRYLDCSLSKINKFIKTNKKLIEVLKEQKQAEIDEAVTKGLNLNVKMKLSGINWLGDLPEHWKVVYLNRYLTGIEQGWSPVAAQGKLGKDQWAVLTLSAVKQGYFYQHENKPLSPSAPIKANLEIQQGDFLLARSNTRSLVGDVCVVEHTRPKLIFSDLIYRINCMI